MQGGGVNMPDDSIGIIVRIGDDDRYHVTVEGEGEVGTLYRHNDRWYPDTDLMEAWGFGVHDPIAEDVVKRYAEWLLEERGKD